MSGGAAAGGAAAAAAQARIRARLASGVIVKLEPREWLDVLARETAPLVVHARGGFLRAAHTYLTSHRGLAFVTRSPDPLELPPDAERIDAERIWTP